MEFDDRSTRREKSFPSPLPAYHHPYFRFPTVRGVRWPVRCYPFSSVVNFVPGTNLRPPHPSKLCLVCRFYPKTCIPQPQIARRSVPGTNLLPSASHLFSSTLQPSRKNCIKCDKNHTLCINYVNYIDISPSAPYYEKLGGLEWNETQWSL